MNYAKNTIIQAKDLVDTIGKFDLKEDNTKYYTLDIENMHPSIKYSIVETAVKFFSGNLGKTRKQQSRVA